MSEPPADPPKHSQRSTLRVIGWTFGGFLLVSIAACLLINPLVLSSGRVQALHVESKNNVRQQNYAVINYFGRHGAFPPHAEDRAASAPSASWMTAILPQMDERSLHQKIDFKKPFDAPANAAEFSTVVRPYTSPHVGDDPLPSGLAPAHYAGNELVFVPGLSIDDISNADGAGNTLQIGEVNAATGAPTAWGDPANLRSAAAPVNGPTGFGANGPGVMVVGFCDGRVTNFNPDMDPAVLAALGTPDGGEEISHDDF